MCTQVYVFIILVWVTGLPKVFYKYILNDIITGFVFWYTMKRKAKPIINRIILNLYINLCCHVTFFLDLTLKKMHLS